MGWPSKLTDRELKRDSLLMSCTSPGKLNISTCTNRYNYENENIKSAKFLS